MSEVLVGSAYSTMELRYQQFAQGASVVEQTIQRLLALSKTPITVQAQIAGAGSGAGALPAPASRAQPTADELKYAQALARTSEAEARRASATARRTEYDARAARATAQASLAEQKQQTEVAKTAAAEDRAATAALRRQQAEDRAAKAAGAGGALPRTFAGITSGGLNQVAGLAGGAFSIQALLNASQESLALKETQNGLKAVAGSTETYSHVLATARQEQELFGGTLRENIQGLTGLTITSNQSGASLDKLIDLSQRLAVLDPEQGAAGARVALNEALSGDPTSLARRYEIPRAALAKLRDESTSASDKLLIIDQYLNKVGISSEAVAGRIDQDALAFRKAKAEIEEATLKLGDYLTKLGAVPARGLTGLLDQGTVAPEARDAGNQAQAGLLSGATSYKNYADQVTAANDQISASFAKDPVAGFLSRQLFGLQALNPVQFAYAQSLVASGTAQSEAIQKAQALTDVTKTLSDAQAQATHFGNAQAGAFTALIPQITAVAALSEDTKNRVLAMSSGFLQGELSERQFRAGLEALTVSNQAQIDIAAREGEENNRLIQSFQGLGTATQQSAFALSDEAQKKLDSTIASANLASEQARVDASSKLAAVGLLGAGDQAEILAQKYNIATNEARFLIAQQQQIGKARADADQRAGERSGGAFTSASDQKAFADSQRQQALAANQAAEAQARYQQALGNNKPILAYLENQLKQVVKGSAAYYDIQSQIVGIEKAGGRKRVDAAATTGLQLAQTEQNSQLAILKAQREGQERQRDQQQDYELNRSRKQEDYEEQRRKLLDSGQRKQADLLAQQFAKEQRRAAEDFNIARQRTNRNNAEATGDIGDRTDLRQSQIGDRAALRGGRPASSAPIDLGSAPPTLTGTGGRAQTPQPILLRVQIAPTQVQIDGHTIVELTWPETEQRIDAELSDELGTIGIILPPGGGQTAVAGPRS